MPRANTGPVEILARAAWLEEQVDALPEVKGTDRASWMDSRNRHMAAVKGLLEKLDQLHPAISVRNDAGTAVVSSMGIRTTSAIGIASALRNWIQLARKKARDPDRCL